MALVATSDWPVCFTTLHKVDGTCVLGPNQRWYQHSPDDGLDDGGVECDDE